ncbi:MAG: phage tail sheath subtilisin-like domain-containing protein [Roseiflexaceae bacterium]
MPVTPTYPGVYIEELPSGVRTLTGVPTSVAAFVGAAARGPVDQAYRITSWADFERVFGGLWAESPMSYAVYHYYQNGGAEAVVVRVARTPPEDDNTTERPTAAVIKLPGDQVTLIAKSVGLWGNNLRARVEYPTGSTDTYHLQVRDTVTGFTEQYLNVSIKSSDPQSLRTLLARSTLVMVGANEDKRPGAHEVVDLGNDPFAGPPSSGQFSQAEQGRNGASITADDIVGSDSASTGIYALRKTDIFNLLVIPPPSPTAEIDGASYSKAAALCAQERAMLIVDAPSTWTSAQDITDGNYAKLNSFTNPIGVDGRNAALFFPWVLAADPLRKNTLRKFAPSGMIAGVFARTDTQRGVWKAPAGTDATLNGVQQMAVALNDSENGLLNPVAVNCLRMLPVFGPVVWGARTMRGADQLADDDYKYIPVRRLTLYIEESLYRGLRWVVFEPNDEPLWSQIRLNAGAFMQNLFRQGAFKGSTPREAYFVKCDKDTTTQNDINLGIVNVIVGFAPLKPAEFVIVKIQQMAGQIQV